MFEKLIVSEPEGADFKNRRSYFMVSSLVVGVLFLAAVVISIFASDYGLGKGGFELVELIAPPEMTTVEPETPQPRTQAAPSHSTSQLPTRQVNMINMNENPIIPKDVSVVPNTQQARPNISYQLGPRDTNPETSNGSGRNTTGPGTSDPGLSITQQVADNTNDIAPPPVKKDPLALKKPPTQSLGVINGRAEYLPKPTYSATAKAVGAQGKVDVQVSIDEAGNVTSAHAISGHPLLRSAAEQAARNARFTPTLLSKVPVKVTGVIVYNFMRS